MASMQTLTAPVSRLETKTARPTLAKWGWSLKTTCPWGQKILRMEAPPALGHGYPIVAFIID
jgi:hypothetical protein